MSLVIQNARGSRRAQTDLEGEAIEAPLLGTVSVETWWTRSMLIFSSFLILLSSGASYSFSAYAPELKKQFGYSEAHLEMLGEAMMIGNCFGPLVGFLIQRYSEKANSIMITCALVGGYFFVHMALVLATSAPYLHIPAVLALCYFTIGFGTGHAFMKVLDVLVYSYAPDRRGIISGILLSSCPLMAFPFSKLFFLALGGDVRLYMLVVSAIMLVAGSFSILFIRRLGYTVSIDKVYTLSKDDIVNGITTTSSRYSLDFDMQSDSDLDRRLNAQLSLLPESSIMCDAAESAAVESSMVSVLAPSTPSRRAGTLGPVEAVSMNPAVFALCFFVMIIVDGTGTMQ
jgi:hypothetical protein